MLSLMLPESVVGCEIRGDVAEPLFPQVRSYLERAVEGRRAEFATVRFCARRALGGLGLDRPVMVPGPHREPSWPDGVVGAMTHCEGYRAAAVAWARDADAIGIDAEPNGPLPSGVLGMVASCEEQEHVRGLRQKRPGLAFDRLLFSIKESVYKAWFPRERSWLGFEDAEVGIDPEGAFVARVPLGEADGLRLAGRWGLSDGVLVTALVRPGGLLVRGRPDTPVDPSRAAHTVRPAGARAPGCRNRKAGIPARIRRRRRPTRAGMPDSRRKVRLARAGDAS